MFLAFAKNGTGIFAKLIRLKTGSPYHHVEIGFDEIDTKTHVTKCFSAQLGEGVRWKDIDFFADPEHWTIVYVERLTKDELNKATAYCDGLAGRKYDLLGILGIGFGIGEHEDSDRFCSETGIGLLQYLFGWFLNIPRWRVAPGNPGNPQRGLYELITAKLAGLAGKGGVAVAAA
jgi:hypothetical protein